MPRARPQQVHRVDEQAIETPAPGSQAEQVEHAVATESKSAEVLYFPPWATPEYDRRLVELSDIQSQADIACAADNGVDFGGYSWFDVPLYFRSGSMTTERAEQFGYGATYSVLANRAGVAAAQGRDRRIPEVMPRCSVEGDAARLAAGEDFLDPFDPEKLRVLGELSRQFEDSDEYAAWAAEWHACMRRGDVEPRQEDPMAHERTVQASLSGALAGEDLIVPAFPADRRYSLEWFSDSLIDNPEAQASFERERLIARADAACTLETSGELATALAILDF